MIRVVQNCIIFVLNLESYCHLQETFVAVDVETEFPLNVNFDKKKELENDKPKGVFTRNEFQPATDIILY